MIRSLWSRCLRSCYSSFKICSSLVLAGGYDNMDQKSQDLFGIFILTNLLRLAIVWVIFHWIVFLERLPDVAKKLATSLKEEKNYTCSDLALDESTIPYNYYFFILMFIVEVMLLVHGVLVKRDCSARVFSENFKSIIEFGLLISLGVFFGCTALLSTNLMAFYASIEGLSLTTFFCIARHAARKGSKELFFKYFCFSSFASVLFITGSSTLYLVTQSIHFTTIKLVLFMHKQSLQSAHSSSINLEAEVQLLTLATCLIVISFLFKVGSFPFHFIVPDLYEASSVFFLMFYNFILKGFYLLLLILLVAYVFSDINHIVSPVLLASGSGSLYLGTLGAYSQRNFWRFLGYASIAQIGLILFGVSTAAYVTLTAVSLFFIGYLIATLVVLVSVFCLVTHFKHTSNGELGGGLFSIIDVVYPNTSPARNQGSKITFCCYLSLVCAMCSFAALPPFIGFITKYLLLTQFIKTETLILAFFVVVLNMVSTYYYLRVVELFTAGIHVRTSPLGAGVKKHFTAVSLSPILAAEAIQGTWNKASTLLDSIWVYVGVISVSGIFILSPALLSLAGAVVNGLIAKVLCFGL